MSLLTEVERDKVVQEMCKNGAYTGAAEFIETWVFSEIEHQALLEEAKTLANYEDKTFFEQLADVRDLVDEANSHVVQGQTAEEIAKKAKPPTVKERMSDEFGSDGWSKS